MGESKGKGMAVRVGPGVGAAAPFTGKWRDLGVFSRSAGCSALATSYSGTLPTRIAVPRLGLAAGFGDREDPNQGCFRLQSEDSEDGSRVLLKTDRQGCSSASNQIIVVLPSLPCSYSPLKSVETPSGACSHA